MSAVWRILYGAGLTVGASVALGALLLADLRHQLRRLEFAVFAFLCGSAALSLIVFLLGTVHLVRRGALQALAAVLIAAALWRHRRSRGEALPPLPRLWRWVLAAVLAVYGFQYFFHALAPEVSPDGAAYHLEVVGAYARAKGLIPMPANMYASLSQGIEMLFLFAYLFGRNSAAAMVHFAYLLALPLLLVSYGRRFGAPAAGAFAAVAVFACPLAGIDGISAYNDIALAAAAFGAFYLFRLWEDSQDARLLAFAGLLAGYCYALKYTGAFVIPLILGWAAWRAGRAWWKALLVAGIPAAAMVLPWLAKNWIWAGNPLAPFFNRWFPNPYVTVSFEIGYRANMAVMQDGSSRWAGLWDALVSGHQSQGAIGPLFILAPLALLALRRSEGRRLFAFALVLLPGYVSNFGARFLLPLLPFVSLAMGMTLQRPAVLLPLLAVAHAVISLPQVLPKYLHPYAWRLDNPPFDAALRRIPEDQFIAMRLPSYPAARKLDAVLPGVQKIFAVSMIPQAYTRHQILVFYQSALGHQLREFLMTATERAEETLLDYRYGFTPVRLKKIRVRQLGPPADGEWSISEMRVWNGGAEVPRQPRWRIDARPNPWDVPNAFDNNLITRWCSREPVKPGMWVEIDFGGVETVDAVGLEAGLWQPVSLRVEGLGESGSWMELANRAEERNVAPQRGRRRAAMAEFKARGVHYLIVDDHENLAEDLHENASYWGITQVFEIGGMRLYRID
jgi:hypothetical protein